MTFNGKHPITDVVLHDCNGNQVSTIYKNGKYHLCIDTENQKIIITDGYSNSINLIYDSSIQANRLLVQAKVESKNPTNTTVVRINANISNVTLLNSNENRLGASIWNDGNKKLFLKMGTNCSTTSFSVILIPNAYFEIPYNYIGQIDGVWENGVGVQGGAQVTEFI